MKHSNLLLLLAFALPSLLTAQNRYFDPVFAEVKVTADVAYGFNVGIPLNIPQFDPVLQALLMDVYEPEGDTALARPLVILVHGGNFLPALQNGTCNGTKRDGEIVELAKRLAQRGYVAAAIDYRLGWNPIANTELARRFTFVNAVHRGVQDSRTCVRFFKKDHAEGGQFRIDPEKITLWGTGTGSYISLASATLDDMDDWDRAKFRVTPTFLMVQDTFNGNLDGTTVGIVSPIYNQITGYPIGDTLCSPNHLGYSSDFALAVNMSEGLLDSSWLQHDDIPILSFASSSVVSTLLEYLCDMYTFGFFDFPFYSPVLVEIAGSRVLQARQAELGNNAVWLNANFSDPLSAHSLSINEGHEGFYPFWGSAELTPWAFGTLPVPSPPNLVCDTSSVGAKVYLDTVLAYFAPRACAALGLNANCNMAVAAKEPLQADFLLKINPNPAIDEIQVVADKPMLSIELYDLHGKIVWQKAGAGDLEVSIPRGNWPHGFYFLKATFGGGSGVTKVLWE